MSEVSEGYEFSGPGGTEYDDKAFLAGMLRADLCEIAILINYASGAKIVDAILAQYNVEPKNKFNGKRVVKPKITATIES